MVCRSEKNKISILHKTRPGRISGGNNGKVSGRIPSCISTGSRIFTCLRGNPPPLPDIVLGRDCSRWQSSTNASCNVLGLSYTEIPIRARRRVARTPFVEKTLTFRAIERLLSALFLLIVSFLINYLFSLFLFLIHSHSLIEKEREDILNQLGIPFQFPYIIFSKKRRGKIQRGGDREIS